MNRLAGVLLGLAACGATGELVRRDVLPHWLAGDPPAALPADADGPVELRTQTGIYDSRGQRIGTSWTALRRVPGGWQRDTRTFLRPAALPVPLPSGELYIGTLVQFTPAGVVDTLRVVVSGLGVPIELRSDYFSPHELPCQWRVGDRTGRIVLGPAALRTLSDALRPMDRLPGLWVGRSWRVALIDPLPRGGPGGRPGARNVLVRVTAQERIVHHGRLVDAFRVEAPGLIAWAAAADGRVLRQRVDLPLLGRLWLIDEPYDPQREELRRRTWPGGILDR